MNVEEQLIDNRHKFLDIMCIPTLFLDGSCGKHHQQDHKLSHSEYIKSRLLNKDSRFRKEPRYVSLLWLKEMREISAGAYNMLKCPNAQTVHWESSHINII